MLEVVILAAGKSQRFGGIKQLAMVNDRSMLEHCIAQYFCDDKLLAGIAKMTVVLGANEARIRQTNLHKVNLFSSPNWQSGMGASLADFVKQLPQSTSHLLVGLADQIALRPADLTALLRSSEQFPDAIVCAQYADVRGVPAIFPRYYFAELAQLDGDKGARKLLILHAANLRIVDMPNAVLDIDTQQDLTSALAKSI